MQRARLAELEARAVWVAAKIVGAEVVPSIARVGGGAAPTRELPSYAVRVAAPDAEALARALRAGDPPIVGRIEDGAVMLDLRAIDEPDDERLAEGVLAAASRVPPR
jgi:L-seryl-tRNA(Ser) seleniumtransferase